MIAKIWLRAETKPNEQRSALTPQSAKALLAAGHQVFVERSTQSAIPAQAFADIGCTMTAPGSWPQAPDDAYILGLKELPETGEALKHKHIYFAHAYKQQHGWQATLNRFVRGGGELFDLEFLLDENARRIAAFGYWAGFAGAAVAVKAWCGQQTGAQPVIAGLSSYTSQDALLAALRSDLAQASNQASNQARNQANSTGENIPSMLVIGAAGRVGTGACTLAEQLGLPVTRWDIAETARGGPFEEILAHTLFVNCVLVNRPLPPFITSELLARPNRQLSVISDVSCDPYGDYNPLPVYTECTTFEQPTQRLIDAPTPLDLIAIDHLPSMLPVESSEDFSQQLLPHLLQLDPVDNPVWRGARAIFREKIALLSY